MRFQLPISASWSGSLARWKQELMRSALRSENDIIAEDFDLSISTDTGATITTTESVYGSYVVDGGVCRLWAYWTGSFSVSSPNYIILEMPVRIRSLHSTTTYKFGGEISAYVNASGWQDGFYEIPAYGPKMNLYRSAGVWTSGATSAFRINTSFPVE